MSSFQECGRRQGEGGSGVERVILEWRHLTNTFSARVKTKVKEWQVKLIVGTLDMTWWKWHSTSGAFFSKTEDPIVIQRKLSDKPSLRGILWNIQPVLLNVHANVGVLSHARHFATLWTVAHQAPLSMEFSRNGLPFPPPGDLPHLGIQPTSPASPELVSGFLRTETAGKPQYFSKDHQKQGKSKKPSQWRKV